MSPSEVEAFLEMGRNLQVATLGSDGFPHLTTLWYLMVEGLVTFHSFTKSQRVLNLTRDRRLTVLVEDGDVYAELRGVMIKGRARLDQDPERSLRLFRATSAKYHGMELDEDQARAIWAPWAIKDTVVTVEPVSIVSWDHRKLEGAY
jgi:nitroimidazol reductase NimA-like FMN-containing flavoprotein (pyridoxamine 5'-phosphate oxidase superfamily)